MKIIDDGELIPDERGRMLYEDELFTGLAVDALESGQRLSEIYYEDGVEHGLSREWYENGVLKSESPYELGQPIELCKEWYENGLLKAELGLGVFFTTLWCKEWDEQGNLIQDFVLDEESPDYKRYQLRLKTLMETEENAKKNQATTKTEAS